MSLLDDAGKGRPDHPGERAEGVAGAVQGAVPGRARVSRDHAPGAGRDRRGRDLLGADSKALVEAGLHPATGGTGLHACSSDMLLEALAACAGVTLNAVATALDIEVRGGRVFAEGDLDFRGTLGVAKDAPVGFRDIRLRFELDSDADAEQLATLEKLTERYCVVFQTLKNPPALSVGLRAG